MIENCRLKSEMIFFAISSLQHFKMIIIIIKLTVNVINDVISSFMQFIVKFQIESVILEYSLKLKNIFGNLHI